MDLSRFTPSQLQAIKTIGKNILVSAGAGSGKTEVLSTRIIYFLTNFGYHIEDFLVLTFTNLASFEMKERIYNAICKEGLIEEAEKIDSASIQTFDSYALNLVKKYHQLLGKSKDLKIVEESALIVYKRKVISEIFDNYYNTHNQEFLKFIDKYCFKNDNEIVDFILQVYSKLNIELDSTKFFNNYSSLFYSQEKIDSYFEFFLNKLLGLIEDLRRAITMLPSVRIKKDSDLIYQDEVFNHFSDFLASSNYDEIISAFNKKLPFNAPRGLDDTDKENVNNFKDLVNEIDEFISSIPKTKDEFIQELNDNNTDSHIVFTIIEQLDYEVKKYKQDKQVFDFNDIAKDALSLIMNNEEIRNEVKNKYKMIMIDEYQDTSLIQDLFISNISNNNVYMVGDIKQSIYRFRNARCDIFIDKYNSYKENSNLGIAIDLNTNFRSRKEVLYDINHLFAPLMTASCGGADYEKYHMIDYGNLGYEKNRENINYHSDIYLYKADTSYQNIITEAHIIARDIVSKINSNYQVMDIIDKKPIMRPVRYSDFCILMDRGTNFLELSQVLGEYMIPLYIESDEDISKNSIILVLNNLLRIIRGIITNDYSSSEFKKSYLSLARSFIFEYDDNTIYNEYTLDNLEESNIIIKIKELIDKYSYYSLSQMIKNIIFDLNIYSLMIKIGDITKNEECLNLFISLIDNLSDLDYNIDDVISYMDDIDKYDLKINLSSTKIDVDSVRMMNIHKSKGLEFKIIYFPLLFKKFNRDYQTKSFGFNSSYGLFFPVNIDNRKSIIKQLIVEHEEIDAISEEVRLFYVSLTRAKEKMIFILPITDTSPLYKNYERLNEGISLSEVTKDKAYYLNNAFHIVLDKDNNIDLYRKIVSYLGYKVKTLSKYNDRFVFNSLDYTNDNSDISINDIINNAYLDYQKGKISYQELKEIVKVFDKYLSNALTSNSGKDLSYYIYDKTRFHLLDKYNSFSDFLVNNIDYSFFNFRLKPKDASGNKTPKKISQAPLIIKDLSLTNELIKKTRASKQISFNVSLEKMAFGTNLHFVLEVMDFINPDYQGLDKETKEIVSDFLKSPIMKDVSKGKVYKEYEFYDEEINLNGIIDLMIIYDDHIDIIDYKTKKIDDENYDNQITMYVNYISKVFKIKTNGYLYSLINRTIKKII